MRLLISVTNAFAKWLKLELERMPSPDGKRIGTQPLVSDEETLAWQCHVVRAHNRAVSGTVIAVEARSRYTLLIPFDAPPTAAEFQGALRRRWAVELVHLLLEHGVFGEDAVPELFGQFNGTPMAFQWYRNTDLSVNGHVADAEQWVLEAFEKYGVTHFDEGEAMWLGQHINQFFKRAKVNGKRGAFYPIPRFLDDALYRFAKGLAPHPYPDTPRGDFPSPYREENARSEGSAVAASGKNVVSLAEYLRKKEGR